MKSNILVVLAMVMSLAAGSRPALAIQAQKADLAQLVREAGVVVKGRVQATRARWIEDRRGRHIWTQVTLRQTAPFKGRAAAMALFEVAGGVVGEIGEIVSDQPTFDEGEEVVVFLKPAAQELFGGQQGKIPVADGMAYVGGQRVTAASLDRALKALAQNPAAAFSLEPVIKRRPAALGLANVQPVITRISPGKTSAGTNMQITIQGTGFGAKQGTGYVEFNPMVRQTKVVSWSATRIVCVVPPKINSGPVRVAADTGVESYGVDFLVTYSYSQVKWAGDNPTISYKINENTSDCTGEGAAVQAATKSWNNAGGNFHFKYTGAHKQTVSSRNNVNEILWGATGGSGSTLAETSIWYNTQTMRIVECDTVFADRWNWHTNKTTSYDVETIALHELGHWMTLADQYGTVDAEYDPGKVMYGYNAGQLKRALQCDDISGVTWIYGGKPNYPARATISDAWWNGRVDMDHDGYVSQGRLNWNPDVNKSGTTLTVYEKIYRKPHAYNDSFWNWTAVATTAAHKISGQSSTDNKSYVCKMGNDVLRGLYDWKIEIYQSGLPYPAFVRNMTNDADLNGMKLESPLTD